MRFDEFTAEHGVTVIPVDEFPGLVVEVGIPPDWELFDSAVGMRVWICRTDPRIDTFCANAVLTLHRVEAALDPRETFTMLSDQQLKLVPGSLELRREVAAATEDSGIVGVLAQQISHELGTVDSVSRSRIITVGQETLIAQFTVTALHNSPVKDANIWLALRRITATGSTFTARSACGIPVAAKQNDTDDV